MAVSTGEIAAPSGIQVKWKATESAW